VSAARRDRSVRLFAVEPCNNRENNAALRGQETDERFAFSVSHQIDRRS
jgi:hypothetical protein